MCISFFNTISTNTTMNSTNLNSTSSTNIFEKTFFVMCTEWFWQIVCLTIAVSIVIHAFYLIVYYIFVMMCNVYYWIKRRIRNENVQLAIPRNETLETLPRNEILETLPHNETLEEFQDSEDASKVMSYDYTYYPIGPTSSIPLMKKTLDDIKNDGLRKASQFFTKKICYSEEWIEKMFKYPFFKNYVKITVPCEHGKYIKITEPSHLIMATNYNDINIGDKLIRANGEKITNLYFLNQARDYELLRHH